MKKFADLFRLCENNQTGSETDDLMGGASCSAAQTPTNESLTQTRLLYMKTSFILKI